MIIYIVRIKLKDEVILPGIFGCFICENNAKDYIKRNKKKFLGEREAAELLIQPHYLDTEIKYE